MLVVVTSVSSLHTYIRQNIWVTTPTTEIYVLSFIIYLLYVNFNMADNFLQMFVGGRCRFMFISLINFWFVSYSQQQHSYVNNRVGDFGLALGIFAVYLKFKSIDYAVVLQLLLLLWEIQWFSNFG